MEAKRQGGKNDHVVIVTSEAEGAKVKKIRIKRWVVVCISVCFCVIVGAVLGYFINEERIRMKANAKIETYKSEVDNLTGLLEEERASKESLRLEYQHQIDELNNKLTILSDTVNQNVVEIEELTMELEAYGHPSLLPLTGSATIEVPEGEQPKCVFNATDGALIIATAKGIVSEVVEEAEAGYRITIDHGNGYVTVYYNDGEPKVKYGDEVRQGATLFVVETINAQLIYQIAIDGVFVNPMDIMQISG